MTSLRRTLLVMWTLSVLAIGCTSVGEPPQLGGEDAGGGSRQDARDRRDTRAPDDDTGTATPDAEAGSDGDGDADPDAAAPDGGGETDTGATCPNGCPEGEVCTERGCSPGCTETTQCPLGTVCQAGLCATEACNAATDCTRESTCARAVCETGACVYRFTLATPADPVAGDCKALACENGQEKEVPNDADLPPDDGIACTVETCSSGAPFFQAVNARCDDGIAANGTEVCSIPDGGCTNVPPDWLCENPIDPGYTGTEVCDGVDNNNNGQVDEGCPCTFGTTQACFRGAPGQRGVGGCSDGIQQCIDRTNPRWSECRGGSTASNEICDQKDNDCNGCEDDLPDCDSTLNCPTEDVARPLTYYTLDGPSVFGPAAGWRWQVVPPANSGTRGPEQPTSAVTRVFLDVSGEYRVTLTADDGKGVKSCTWIVRARGDGLRVEMVWDTFGSVDIDLHMHRSGSTQGFCTSDDCYYANCAIGRGGLLGGRTHSINWGYADSQANACRSAPCKNPRLDIDNISAYDPENINIDNPRNGDTFRVMAHMYSGSRATKPRLSFYCGGELRSVLGAAPDQVTLTSSGGSCQGQTWRVADVTMQVDPATGATDCVVTPLLPNNNWDVRTNTGAY